MQKYLCSNLKRYHSKSKSDKMFYKFFRKTFPWYFCSGHLESRFGNPAENLYRENRKFFIESDDILNKQYFYGKNLKMPTWTGSIQFHQPHRMFFKRISKNLDQVLKEIQQRNLFSEFFSFKTFLWTCRLQF